MEEMNTPTTRDFLRRPTGARRRSSRQALAVIPVNNSTASPGETVTTEVNAMDNFLNSRQGSEVWSPAPSPDELVIQKRGRRRRPIVWSPDLDTCKRNSLFSSRDHTPVKSPSKSSMVLRSTPRKRLSLGDANDSEFTTPEKKKKSQGLLDSNNGQRYYGGTLLNGLRGLSHEQLVQMIMDMVAMQEQGILCEGEKMHNLLLKKMPMADIQPLIDNLNNLKQNIRLSMASSSSVDLASNHGCIYLDNYQRAIIDQGKRLVESQHWMSVMHYVYSAWNVTKQLQEWENQNLCDFVQKCFKNLTHFCSQALKKGSFTNAALDMFSSRIDAMMTDYDDLKVCLQLIKEAKQN